jgi:hypothetical protein
MGRPIPHRSWRPANFLNDTLLQSSLLMTRGQRLYITEGNAVYNVRQSYLLTYGPTTICASFQHASSIPPVYRLFFFLNLNSHESFSTSSRHFGQCQYSALRFTLKLLATLVAFAEIKYVRQNIELQYLPVPSTRTYRLQCRYNGINK